MDYRFDAVIIGGGASGLMCAVAAKQKNPEINIAVLEKNDRVGKKLLATGNGRCNLTNEGVQTARYAGSFKKQSGFVFGKIDTAALLSRFRSLGLLTEKDGEGRYYPLCRQAASVLDVLRFQCESLGVELFCGTTIKSIRRQNGFVINTDQGSFTAEKLVIAAGSKAAPKLGGSGSAADILKNLGHSFIPFSPALCPLMADSDILRSLKGLRAQALVTLNGRQERGEVQFNGDSISGICVFDLSLYAKSGDVVTVDLLPDISENELFDFLINNKNRFSAQPADCLFTGILARRHAQAVMKVAGIKGFSRPCSSLSVEEIKKSAAAAKILSFKVKGLAGFDRAQACRGGVPGGELDEKTMKSRKVKNLYICGEAVDLCGECGGYNLHFAFASGIIAGESL